MIAQTDRLSLRRFTIDDLPLLVELDSDPEVMRYLTGGRPTPAETVRREVLPAILRDYLRFPGFGKWAAIERSSGAFIGWFALKPAAAGPAVTGPAGAGPASGVVNGRGGRLAITEVELGYRLRRASWGRGYASEGARALLRMAFDHPTVDRVFAETMAVNVASRRVMEAAGLRLARCFHLQWDDPIEGVEHGEVEYEVRRVDWAAHAAAASGTRTMSVARIPPAVEGNRPH
ncbi:RimJ/RimL family protein N-acetyltransferase [Micromonospora sp. Llam0]|uniref:GNAT family N-acetyltransferase n=1 Tax=Micromonospora sp. Llam0 TaxID=2485143 RepID=UPI000F462DA1|nr:GNAT family N-acetyltransferase [Micromonospora sp. Llam0]ROO61689.1 RimJ/RimL family protein N-acetyltransferase [Micromonospora sp. Llam0]